MELLNFATFIRRLTKMDENMEASNTLEVRAQLDLIPGNIVQIRDLIGAIENRLGGVLRAPGPMCETDSNEPSSLVPLAHELRVTNCELEELVLSLQSIINRLEL
jgi:hypothetical protein